MDTQTTQPPATHDPPPAGSRRMQTIALAAMVAILLAAAWGVYNHTRNTYRLPPVSFSGDSSALETTDVAATLQAPTPPGRNVVWSAAFPAAWQELVDRAGGPVVLTRNQALAERLNAAAPPPGTLPEDEHLAVAGSVGQGVLELIREEMHARFPHVPLPELYTTEHSLVVFAFLLASPSYPTPLLPAEEPMVFTASDGTRTPVRAFGLPPRAAGHFAELRRQVRVLHTAGEGRAFVVSLPSPEGGYRVLLARVPRRQTLAAALADVQARIAGAGEGEPLAPHDSLLVPVMFWRLRHRFRALEGPNNHLVNNGLEAYRLTAAVQTIECKLDHAGVPPRSGGPAGESSAPPRRLHFDGPFLLAVQRAGAAQPMLALWVDNAELLSRPTGD